MEPIIPRCAKHPTWGVMTIPEGGGARRVWICLKCNARIARAPDAPSSAINTDDIITLVD